MEVNRNMIIGLIIWLVISAGVWYLVLFHPIEQYKYEMPNDVICKSSTITGGGFGGATNEFSACSDGRRYINPETYKKIKLEKGVRIIDVILGLGEQHE